MALIDQHVLALEASFQNRVRTSAIAAAIAIQGEAIGGSSAQKYQKRQALARLVLSSPDGQKSRFASAVATNSTVAAGVGSPVAVASSTNANPTVVTTSAVHGLSVGDAIVIENHATNTVINGGWIVATVPLTTTFTIAVSGVGAGTGGTVRKHPPDTDINNAISALWDDLAGVDLTD